MSFTDRYLDVYQYPKGTGDARPTTLQIVKDEDHLRKLGGKVVLITGGSQDINMETVLALHATGADVYFTVRSTSAGDKVMADVKSTSLASGKLVSILMHLDDLSSVKAGVNEFLKRENKLNIVNYLTHFHLFQLLNGALLAGSEASPGFASRVVNVSSVAHRSGQVRFDDFNFDQPSSYDPWLAYGQSKTALIWLANHIERLFGSHNPPIHAWSFHPSGILTNLQLYIPEDVKKQWNIAAATNPTLMSTAQGAATTVLAAIAKGWEGQGGKYFKSKSFPNDVIS